MKHRFPIFALALALALGAQAAMVESSKPSIIEIVYRNIAPGIRADSFGAKPKTIYIGGETYARLEEEPNSKQHIHGLLITNGSNIWMINLFARRGLHMIDPGPAFVTHHNILGLDAAKEFSTLEFGKELDFFRNRHATPVEAKVIEGQSCDGSEYRQAPYRVVLYLRTDTQAPFQLDIFKDNTAPCSVRYLSYETGTAFDAGLFQPPADVTMTEVKSGSR